MLNFDKVVILDIEGNSAKKNEELKITQFSAIVIQDGKQQEVNYFNRNVNLIPPIVQRMTHLTISKLKQEGMSEKRMVKQIHELLSDADIIYAYGYEFDKRVLRLMFNKYHHKELSVPWVEVQEIVKERLNPEHLKLSTVAKELGFEGKHFHDSLVDCKAILHIIEYLNATKEEEVAV